MKRLLCTAIFVFLFSVPVFAADFPMSAGEYGSVTRTVSMRWNSGMGSNQGWIVPISYSANSRATDLSISVVYAGSSNDSVVVSAYEWNNGAYLYLWTDDDVTSAFTCSVTVEVSFKALYNLDSDPIVLNFGTPTQVSSGGYSDRVLLDKLDEILSNLTDKEADSLAITPISYLSSADDFYTNCTISGSSVSDGVWSLSQSSTSTDFGWNGISDWSKPYPGNLYFISGQQYLISLSWAGTVSNLDDLFFQWQGNVDNPVVTTSGSGSSIRSVLSFVYTPSFNELCTLIRFSGAQFSFNPGEVSFSAIPADMESIAGSAVPDEWEDTNQQLDSAASDLHSVDETVFTDINTYKGQLDFGLDSWSDAAAGLSYVGNIFLILWDNIPTQPIVLALMLGLASLLLGRGAALARRSGRGRRGGDDDA